jgi:hypothetical protein
MKIYSSSLYKKLGLKSEPPISLVKQNLLTLASECRQIDERKESVVELTNVTSSKDFQNICVGMMMYGQLHHINI